MDKFLEQGELTKFTDKVKQVADILKGEGLDYLFSVSEFIRDSLPSRLREISSEELLNKHCKRTADEIISEGWSLDCGDDAIVFVTLARLKGIPTKYIDCVEMKSFHLKPEDPDGHVFCTCEINNHSYMVDPRSGLNVRLHKPSDKGIMYTMKDKYYVTVYQAIDNFEAGVKNHEDMKRRYQQTAMEYLEERIKED